MAVYRQMLGELFAGTPHFTVDDFPDQQGRVAIVTGGNTGIGKETCKVLLNKNCKVYLGARSEEKAQAAITDLENDTGKSEIYYLHLDLADLTTIKQTVQTFLSKEKHLHLLFNNAGVMASPPSARTTQGYEMQLGTNVVGHYLLTKLLLPTMVETAAEIKSDLSAPKDYNVVRIINTSSNGHAGAPTGGFNYDNPNEGASKWSLYGQSKWCNIVHANELAKRYGDKGITAHSLNPGAIKTELTRHSTFFERNLIRPILYPTPMGCLTQTYAGLMPEPGKPERNGSYFIPFGRYGVTRDDVNAPGAGDKLWNWLEKEIAQYC